MASKGLAYEEIELNDAVTVDSLKAVTGQFTTPQVFIGGTHIGGADDLEAYFSQEKISQGAILSE